MKALARSYLWWPKLKNNLKIWSSHVATSCQSVKEAPPVVPLHPWIWPSKPWERIHVDLLGHIKTNFLIESMHTKSGQK